MAGPNGLKLGMQKEKNILANIDRLAFFNLRPLRVFFKEFDSESTVFVS